MCTPIQTPSPGVFTMSAVIVAIVLQTPPPRYKKMSTEQDWTSVWPTAETFKWSVVPFPVRQGYAKVGLLVYSLSGCLPRIIPGPDLPNLGICLWRYSSTGKSGTPVKSGTVGMSRIPANLEGCSVEKQIASPNTGERCDLW